MVFMSSSWGVSWVLTEGNIKLAYKHLVEGENQLGIVNRLSEVVDVVVVNFAVMKTNVPED